MQHENIRPCKSKININVRRQMRSIVLDENTFHISKAFVYLISNRGLKQTLDFTITPNFKVHFFFALLFHI